MAADSECPVHVQDVLALLGVFHMVWLIGSAGCGKTRCGRVVEQLAKALYGKDDVYRVACSSKVAVNAGCETLAKVLGAGCYDPSSERDKFHDSAVAYKVASIKVLIIEEFTAIHPTLMTQFFQVL